MPSQNNYETFRPNENNSEVKTEVPSCSVQNGQNNRPRRSFSLRRRRVIMRAARNSRRQRARNGITPNATTDDDDDFHFFMSLLPYLKDVPRNIRLRIRDKVQRVIIKQLEEYNNANNEGPTNDRNNRILSTIPTSYRRITPEEEMPQFQDPIQHPLPVYPLIPYYNHVYGNVNNFVTPLPQNSEYSFSEQQVIPSYSGQHIFQPVPRFAGQQPILHFTRQQPLPPFARQQPLPPFAGQQPLTPFIGQQQYNTPYFARQQYNILHYSE